MAEYRDIKAHDIPARLRGKGTGDHHRPKPHIDEATYNAHYHASINNVDGT